MSKDTKEDETAKLEARDMEEEFKFEADQDGESVNFAHGSPVVDDDNDPGDYALPDHAEGEWPDKD
jgi:hypothetical protein